MQPKERPILFSAPMVSATLDGRKSMTRVIVKPRHDWYEHEGRIYYQDYVTAEPVPVEVPCPYGSPGDRLWVREAHMRIIGLDKMHRPHYLADGPRPSISERHDAGLLRSFPSIHMPRWASRITLEVDAVRVERLQQISGADLEREGFKKDNGPMRDGSRLTEHGRRMCFAELWESLNGPESWDANPWVWVVSFHRVA